MERVQCVSLPRSGHNLLAGHLQRYFGSKACCSKTGQQQKRLPFFGRRDQPTVPNSIPNAGFHYCEYYYACRSHPCVDASNTFQKSHDFELLMPVHQQQKYIIQKREPRELLISWFEMRLKKGREKDSQKGFADFVAKQQSYIDGFHAKWIDTPLQNRLVLDYDRYVMQPAECMRDVISFFDPEGVPDQEKLEAVIADVRPAKNNSTFRYVDSHLPDLNGKALASRR